MNTPIPESLVEQMRRAHHIVALTGAGISAESGVPTFREAQTGLWAQYDPQQLATPQAFLRDPRLVWEWYQWRRELVGGVRPNPGHDALVEMERRAADFTLITQNVDSLHSLAGSQAVIELHGNLQRFKCYDQGHPVTSWEPVEEPPPHCPICGSLVRPDVVWFGESLPHGALTQALDRSRTADVFLTIGTSGIVHPAATMPLLAKEAGAILVEINPVETELSLFMDHILRGPSGVVLPELVAAVWG